MPGLNEFPVAVPCGWTGAQMESVNSGSEGDECNLGRTETVFTGQCLGGEGVVEEAETSAED